MSRRWLLFLFLLFLFVPKAWAECEKVFNTDPFLSGSLRCFDEQGRLQSLAFYQHGRLHGREQIWNAASGRLAVESNFVDGELQGTRRIYGAEGWLENESHFRKGKKVGEEKEFSSDGRLRMLRLWAENGFTETRYFDEASRLIKLEKPDGPVIKVWQYFADGKVSEESAYLINSPGVRQGRSQFFRADGSRLASESYEAGSLDGLRKVWDPGGNLQTREWYRGGKKISETSYDAAGRVIQSQEFFSNEVLPHQSLYANGNVEEVSSYQGFRKQGNHREYNTEGSLTLQAYYEAGVLEGPLKTFFPDGKISQIAHFRAGVRDGWEETFYQNGKLRSRQKFQLGLRQGRYQSFDDYGRLKLEQTFDQDRLQGVARCLAPDQNLEEIQTYDWGRLTFRRVQDSAGSLIFESEYWPDGSVQDPSHLPPATFSPVCMGS